VASSANHLKVDCTTTLGAVLPLDGGTFSIGRLVNLGCFSSTAERST